MNAHATFTLNEAHFKQVYSDWLRYVSRWRRWSIWISSFLIIIGIVLGYVSTRGYVLPVTMIGLGIIEMLYGVVHKRTWIRDRLASHGQNEMVEIQFTDEGLKLSGPDSESICKWSAFDRCISTPNGLFLWPEKGIHIYVPNSAISPHDVKYEIAANIISANRK